MIYSSLVFLISAVGAFAAFKIDTNSTSYQFIQLDTECQYLEDSPCTGDSQLCRVSNSSGVYDVYGNIYKSSTPTSCLVPRAAHASSTPIIISDY